MVITRKVERAIIATLLIIGVGWWLLHAVDAPAAPTDRPAASLLQVQKSAGCANPDPGVQFYGKVDTGACLLDGADVTFATFDTTADQDSSMPLMSLLFPNFAADEGSNPILVVGPLWLAYCPDLAIAQKVAAALHGTVSG